MPVKGGIEEPLKLPTAFKASYSPDGSRLAVACQQMPPVLQIRDVDGDGVRSARLLGEARSSGQDGDDED